jgi:hypothetical protein
VSNARAPALDVGVGGKAPLGKGNLARHLGGGITGLIGERTGSDGKSAALARFRLRQTLLSLRSAAENVRRDLGYDPTVSCRGIAVGR